MGIGGLTCFHWEGEARRGSWEGGEELYVGVIRGLATEGKKFKSCSLTSPVYY